MSKAGDRLSGEARDKESAQGAATEMSEEASAKAAEAGAVQLDATDQGSAQGAATEMSEEASAKADRAARDAL